MLAEKISPLIDGEVQQSINCAWASSVVFKLFSICPQQRGMLLCAKLWHLALEQVTLFINNLP